MTEKEARALLGASGGISYVEAWIAEQPWRSVPNGWTVIGDLEARQFQLQPVEDGLRVTAFAPEAAPKTWIVPA